MSKSIVRDLLFALLIVAFSGLLLSGGSRLIAGIQQDFTPIQISASWFQASVTCPPDSHLSTVTQEARAENRPCLQTVFSSEASDPMPFLLQVDANGNVIRHVSYMHAVYHAFALGDGFV